ncbi:MAG TPA: YdeI/OmpD-associated family protein [Pseudonocardiaceae bacterium]
MTRLVTEGRMQPAGVAEAERAKADGRWDVAYAGQASIEVAPDLAAALTAEPRAQAMFDILTSQNRYAVLSRVESAKRPDTRAVRGHARPRRDGLPAKAHTPRLNTRYVGGHCLPDFVQPPSVGRELQEAAQKLRAAVRLRMASRRWSARLGRVRSKDVHVCFVCTGNICRSPMAEIVFADALRREGLGDRVRVSSAGTGAWHVGDPADGRAAETLRRAGYHCRHVAAQVGAQHLSADLLVALDRGHLATLRRLGPEPERVVLLRSFDPAANGNLDVPDPYFGGRRGFDDVLSIVRAAVPGLLAWVRGRL